MRYKQLGERPNTYQDKVYHVENRFYTVSPGGSLHLRKLRFILLLALLMMPIVSYRTGQATALPFDGEYADQSVTVGSHLYLDLSLSSGDVVSGYFETHDDGMGLDFFICTEAQYLIWDGGGTASVYESVENMHINTWSLTVPSTDTWYLVFYNDDSETITFDAGVDINGDNTPYYQPSSYDYTQFGRVLEPDEWWYLSGNLAAGTEISGHFSTFFTTDGVDFFICNEENYEIWDSDGSATVYGLRENYHQSAIAAFTVPTSGVWYLVWSALDQADTISLSYGVTIDDSGATGTTSDTNTDTIPPPDGDIMLLAIGGIAAVAVLLVVCVVCNKRKTSGPTPGVQTTRVGPTPGTGKPMIGASQKDIVKGALKSYPRVTMLELADILEMDDDTVRNITLQLIAAGEISGTFDKSTGEFISKDASQVGRELRDSAGILKLPRCPNCGAPLPGDHVIGDRVQCGNCGVSFTI